MAHLTGAMHLLCNVLSTVVVVSCLILKLPQIIAVVGERSTKGISIASVLLELTEYSIMLTYHFALTYPLPTYLEYYFLVPQDLFLLAAILWYERKLQLKVLAAFVLYCIVVYAVAFRIVPDIVLQLLITSSTPLSVTSRLLQICKVLRLKDAGNISAVTWAIATYGTLIRIFTAAVQTGDVAVLLNFFVGFCLNALMVTLIIYFRVKKHKKQPRLLLVSLSEERALPLFIQAMAHLTGAMQLLCNVLSTVVVVSCLILKLPQIIAVVGERSTKGISIASVLLELTGYSIMLTYHFALTYPLLTYLEYCFLVPQDLFLLAAILWYERKLQLKVLAAFVLYCIVVYAVAFRIVPDIVLQLLITSSTPLSVTSKLLQIFKVLRLKDAGNISAVTWAIATYGTLIRSFTAAVQTGDVAVLLNFFASFCLNALMVTLIIYFRVKKHKKQN
ncbi:mannose-P-dolichol utilization defect 1 protein-like [Pomacea canaliculata]|uniref:mannose-P-dolichol utilization defect 1 protein-like n=1 Tax=Pomacea canaliculata TaxID=400727 RepID=UPI000D731DDC|nr:mannose-P-dolichol utilization defect 1 protein-like [Pomacea canaliculata]